MAIGSHWKKNFFRPRQTLLRTPILTVLHHRLKFFCMRGVRSLGGKGPITGISINVGRESPVFLLECHMNRKSLSAYLLLVFMACSGIGCTYNKNYDNGDYGGLSDALGSLWPGYSVPAAQVQAPVYNPGYNTGYQTGYNQSGRWGGTEVINGRYFPSCSNGNWGPNCSGRLGSSNTGYRTGQNNGRYFPSCSNGNWGPNCSGRLGSSNPGYNRPTNNRPTYNHTGYHNGRYYPSCVGGRGRNCNGR